MTEPDPTATKALACTLHRVFEGFVSHPKSDNADNADWETYADEVLDGLRAAGFSLWDLRSVHQDELDDELVLREEANGRESATGDASEASRPKEPGAPRITIGEYHRLIESGVLEGPVELLEGVIELSGEPLVHSPAQTRAAAALGIRVHSAVDAVLQDPQARAEVIDRLQAAEKGSWDG